MASSHPIGTESSEKSLGVVDANEDSLADMVEMLKNVKIKDIVHRILGPGGECLQTWGEVNAYMLTNAKSLSPAIVGAIRGKLGDEYKAKKSERKDFMKALEEAQMDPISGVEVKGNGASDDTRTPGDLINHTKNTRLPNRPGDQDFYLYIAKLLKGVKPENVHTVTETIVSMAIAFNKDLASKGDAGIHIGAHGSSVGKTPVNEPLNHQS